MRKMHYNDSFVLRQSCKCCFKQLEREINNSDPFFVFLRPVPCVLLGGGLGEEQEYWELTNDNVGQASASSFLIFQPQSNNISDNYPAKAILKKVGTKLFTFVEKA